MTFLSSWPAELLMLILSVGIVGSYSGGYHTEDIIMFTFPFFSISHWRYLFEMEPLYDSWTRLWRVSTKCGIGLWTWDLILEKKGWKKRTIPWQVLLHVLPVNLTFINFTSLPELMSLILGARFHATFRSNWIKPSFLRCSLILVLIVICPSWTYNCWTSVPPHDSPLVHLVCLP